jgi:diadenosine tetraphosphate (Ap4A) HIT family hydrolase
MLDCLFCKIISWEIPSVKIWEDDDFIAILDVFPNTKWMTLLIPKNHYNSDLFEISDQQFYTKYLLAVQKVAKILKKWLNVNRVAMVMEWMWVDHLHIKLYPLHWVWPERKAHRAKQEIYFDQYEWYVSTQLGTKANPEDLQKIADEIKNRS